MVRNTMVGRAIPAPGQATAGWILALTGALALALVTVGFVSDDMRPVAAAVYATFGFLVQRGRFCGAALLSRAVLYGERQGVVAVAVAIFVAMVGIGWLDGLGVISAQPKALELVPALVGGALFGVGMVLAGGCVSGSLFKMVEGRVTSMIAMFGIMVGLAVGSTGGIRQRLATTSAGFEAGGLPELVGLSYLVVASVVGLVGGGLLFAVLRGRSRPSRPRWSLSSLAVTGWPVVTVGFLIGMLGWLAQVAFEPLGRHYPLGSAEIPATFLQFLFVGELQPPGMVAWCFVIGAALSAWLRGDMRWRSADRSTLFIALLGGLLVGLGVVVGHGCFVGNMLSGWALLSVHSLVFGVMTVLGNWLTTILYLRGV